MDRDTPRHRHNLTIEEQDREARRDRRYDILDGVKSSRRHRSPGGDRERRRDHTSYGKEQDDRSQRAKGKEPTRERSRDEHSRPRRHSHGDFPEDRSRREYRRRSRSRSEERQARRGRNRSSSPRRSHKSSRRSSRSPRRHRHQRRRSYSRSPSRSVSPPPRKRHRRSRSRTPDPTTARSRKPLPSQQQFFHAETNPDEPPPVEKQKPNFGNSGLLAKEANRVEGTNISLLHSEPPEARKPPSKDDWRVYIFKGDDMLDTVRLRDRSCWLIGREVQVVDLPAEHPSCSKQHAVLQFRFTTRTNDYGDKDSKVRLYLMDLNSSNGTKLNGERIESSRYFEVLDSDVVKFGSSEREYVIQLPPRPS